MQFSVAISLLKGRLSNYQSIQIEQTLKDEMNNTQFFLEQEDFIPWFLLTESSTAQNTALEERLPVPNDFIMEWEEGALQWKKTTETVYQVVNKEDYDYLKKNFSQVDGTPKGYAEAGEYFLIVPPPTDVYDWKMRYFQHQPINVDDEDENVWLKHAGEWLISETGRVIAESYLNNKMATAAFVSASGRAKTRIEKLNVAKAEANRERMMGE